MPLVLLSFTRLIAPPLALVAMAHLAVRLRARDRPSHREIALLSGYSLLALTSPFLWSQVAAQLSGSSAVDRAGTMLRAPSSLGVGWFDILWTINPWAVLVPLILCAWFIRLAVLARRRLGPELCAWAVAYPIFVLLVTLPTPGFLRYFMFAFPFSVGAVGDRTTPLARRVVPVAVTASLLVALQYLWVRYSFVLDPDPSRPVLNP